jgi:hypothetical protein
MRVDILPLNTAFIASVQRALRAYRHDDMLASLTTLSALHLVRAEHNCHSAVGPAPAIRSIIDQGLKKLAQTDSLEADLLIRHYLQGQTAQQIAIALGYSDSAIFTKQRLAVRSLALILLKAEEEAARRSHAADARLHTLASLPPPTFSRLFGVATAQAQLADYLSDPQRHWLTAVEGMGGVGKTALARQVAEDLVCQGRFETVVWITAQQHVLVVGHLRESSQPALSFATLLGELGRGLGLDARPDLDETSQVLRLRETLAGQPTLLVVDNLETAAGIWALTEGLNRLARPAKVLLTTRQRVSVHDQVTAVPLHALSPADALDFLRYHAAERNVPALLAASDADLRHIARVTDGNPLALKLVAGQLLALPLARVLDDLADARPDTHDFYNFLFRYSWQRLSDPARHLLVHMPLLDPRGATWEDLAAVSGVALNGYFRSALEELVAASLLNAGWVQGQMLYTIHRLAEYFLLSDLVGVGHLVQGSDVPGVSL